MIENSYGQQRDTAGASTDLFTAVDSDIKRMSKGLFIVFKLKSSDSFRLYMIWYSRVPNYFIWATKTFILPIVTRIGIRTSGLSSRLYSVINSPTTQTRAECVPFVTHQVVCIFSKRSYLSALKYYLEPGS